ncbi:nicotinate-nicotinamide nucleotide adenylyltransferase [Leptospira ognonensis]|uniref:nicotinate-nucleotide adenylyltransferase n=1 Tax=Leptospira ognonensis TaxID=2484945 RepID=A0A4R9JZ47_9LEPT|nr:nicotinate-nicotinamide nucleotide adenylyltransferase [Leptospira ognonensis]TGL57505.1 nicotinate-nicotinamide nucleotide adenylyltransferase [Leptospira ognonensis]
MIIVYGGSFDPPHLGHFNIVKQLRETFPSAFKIFIFPNRISPFKEEKSLSSQEILKLCQLTFQELLNEQIEIRNSELLRPTASYTFNTVEVLKDEYPEESIHLCIGEDSLSGLQEWHRFLDLDFILEGYIILRRKTISPLPIKFPNLVLENKSIVLSNELWDVSSSRLRNEREIEYAKYWMVSDAYDYLKSIGWFASSL